jgi:ABC-type Fe3+-siderophore transport system permease subunit
LTLFETVIVVLLGILAFVGFLAPFIVSMFVIIDDYKPGWKIWVAASVLSFTCLVLGVWTLSNLPNDEASHCGPGTHYISQDHLVGKTITHNWVCLPD